MLQGRLAECKLCFGERVARYLPKESMQRFCILVLSLPLVLRWLSCDLIDD